VILADFTCAEHGTFESHTDSAADFAPCPTCNTSSPWSPSPVLGKVKIASVSTGKYEPPPTKQYLDTRELGEGMPLSEWRKKREKVHQERRHKSNKELL